MATWLHDVEVYASLAEGERGPARDWALTRLAIYAPERFAAFPDDGRMHDVVFAAGPPRLIDALIASLAQRPLPGSLGSAASAIPTYGLVPEDPSALIAAMSGAIAGNGAESDLWLAYGLSTLHAADKRALAAAAKVEAAHHDWVLPIVLLEVAHGMGAAEEVCKEIVAGMIADKRPMRLLAMLAAMGVPVPTAVWHSKDPKEAADYGASIAHHRPFPLPHAQGSARRRLQGAVTALLDGVPGPVAALIRTACAKDPAPEWGMIPVAVAAWLRARHLPEAGHGHESDPVHDVLFHASGGDPVVVSAARRVAHERIPALTDALAHGTEPAGLVLAVTALRRGNATSLALPILGAHGGRLDSDLRTAACAAVAAASVPDEIPALLRSIDASKRALGLIVAEFVPTQEVLEALLGMAVPADPALRVQFARTLAAMGDNVTAPTLSALVAAGHELDDALALSKALLS